MPATLQCRSRSRGLCRATLAVRFLHGRFDGGIQVYDPAVAEDPQRNGEDEVHDRVLPAALVQLTQSGNDQTAEQGAEPGA